MLTTDLVEISKRRIRALFGAKERGEVVANDVRSNIGAAEVMEESFCKAAGIAQFLGLFCIG